MLLLIHFLSNIAANSYIRSDQAPVFNVNAMKDKEDEQVNDSQINSCFNQTISEFVFCKCAATDVLKTTLIPLNSTPSRSVTATDRLQTVKSRGLSHADWLVLWYHLMWFMRSSVHLNCLLHGEQLFASSLFRI